MKKKAWCKSVQLLRVLGILNNVTSVCNSIKDINETMLQVKVGKVEENNVV